MFKIVLDAGHGINTAGKRCLKSIDQNQTREWVLNSRICDKIQSYLTAYNGYDVLRVDDTTGKKDIALATRVKNANNYGANIYLSIHHNAGIKGGSGGGIVAYTHTKVSKATENWQKELYNAIVDATGLIGNRSTPLAQNSFYVLRKTNMSAVLLELGYMDSTADTPIILTDKFADNVAKAIVDVIVKKGGLVKKETVVTDTNVGNINNAVLEWQKSAIADGFKFAKYGADGKWGSECVSVGKKAVCKKRATYKYRNLTKIVQRAVGVTADGKFGNDTKNAVIKFQKLVGLSADGCVGLETWKKILGVK